MGSLLMEWESREEEKRWGRVGVAGFEPAAPCSRSKCATKLRYTPKKWLDATELELILEWLEFDLHRSQQGA